MIERRLFGAPLTLTASGRTERDPPHKPLAYLPGIQRLRHEADMQRVGILLDVRP